ncbi:hypothetical protein SDC9_148864 [bioreactor metagenome]|uniref:Uncharacterized protein n=1 Tax=bioreactor metagenome TaxID=1076179 RepID=A0A645ELW1_9ZZZZ
MLPRQLHESIHVGGLAEKMHRDDRFGAWRDLARGVGGIEVERHRVDVGEDRLRPDPDDGAGGGEKGEGRGDHFIARADSGLHQGDDQCVGTGGHADGVAAAAISRRLLFEFRDLVAEDEALRIADGFDGIHDLRFQGPVLRRQVQQRYLHDQSKLLCILT